jgi:hypothetical protein
MCATRETRSRLDSVAWSWGCVQREYDLSRSGEGGGRGGGGGGGTDGEHEAVPGAHREAGPEPSPAGFFCVGSNQESKLLSNPYIMI